MDFSVSMRRWRIARVATVALAGGLPVFIAPGLARAGDLPPAPDALQAAVMDAWTRHPQAAAVAAGCSPWLVISTWCAASCTGDRPVVP